MLARICLLIVGLGTILSFFLFGGILGALEGFIFSGIAAVILYCLASSVFTRNATTNLTWQDPSQDVPSQIRTDPSQLPRGAYEPRNES
jgi:hypothetical protein